MKTHPLAGKKLPPEMLVDVKKLIEAYYGEKPDARLPEQAVSFGTSGHRGSSLSRSFNENHILAVTQAVCDYRKEKGINGPLFIGYDTHALSRPAFETALEVLAGNGVTAMIADNDFTPTPAVSHAILAYNASSPSGLADGIVITPSHNPPSDGGLKYDPTDGGPADVSITSRIQTYANGLLKDGLKGVKRIPFGKAVKAGTTRLHDYRGNYVKDLRNIIDFGVIRSSGIRLGVDPLGGSGVNYWGAIAEEYGLDMEIVNKAIDPSFSFMTADWDGKIRMDPSSQYAMKSLISLKDRFEVAFAADPDYDRHGIVTSSGGLMQPNNYLCVAVDYLFRTRNRWRKDAAIGKTAVSSSLLNRVGQGLSRKVCEVPVGFKWFVKGLVDGSFGFGGEESAGASFLRFDGGAWTTDKDGIIMGLLSGEITAATGKDPSVYFNGLAEKYGRPYSERHDAPCTPEMKKTLKGIKPEDIDVKELAGDPVKQIINAAPFNGEPIGGVKISTENSWFAARPSGTENIYKIYAESFRSPEHLARLFSEAEKIINGLRS